jgi:hypothetical protein
MFSMMIIALALLARVSASDDYECPTSGASMHASCQVIDGPARVQERAAARSHAAIATQLNQMTGAE